jgi:acetolactate synthase-1/2/3 large subunit
VNLGSPPLKEAVEAADVVLAVGTELGETEMYPGPVTLAPRGRLIRIDIDPEQLMRAPAAEVPIVGDARLALAALAEALGTHEASGEGARRAAGLRDAARTLWPPEVAVHERVLAVVQKVLPGVVIVGDSTQPVYGGNQFYEPDRPRSWFNSTTGYGTLGYALPAAVGAKLAAPERRVVALTGDGGLQFTLPELASAVEAGTPLIVLLWNNRGYREIRTWMVDAGVQPIGVDLHTPDFLAIARGFGCAAERATGLDELEAALRAAASRLQPTLVELPEEAFVAAP